MPTSTKIREEARHHWDRARRRAIWMNLRQQISGQSTTLLDFNEVAQRLNLHHAVYKGVQNIPLDSIVGSMGRYQDFTGTFLPKKNDMVGRWNDVARIQLNPHGAGLPPIELYRVGKWCFVSDGNHRVSVARELGFNDIEAYVWDYPEPPLDVDPDDIEAMLLNWERYDFLEKTKLNTLRPDHIFEVTVPGGYHYALQQIANYRQVLSKIDGEAISYEDAVTGWYDMYFEGICIKLQDIELARQFPERTMADFFVWVTRHKNELEAEYCENVRITQVITLLEDKYTGITGFLRRIFRRPFKG
jgi:hypothetical protein